jgi:hypothetical protein
LSTFGYVRQVVKIYSGFFNRFQDELACFGIGFFWQVLDDERGILAELCRQDRAIFSGSG